MTSFFDILTACVFIIQLPTLSLGLPNSSTNSNSFSSTSQYSSNSSSTKSSLSTTNTIITTPFASVQSFPSLSSSWPVLGKAAGLQYQANERIAALSAGASAPAPVGSSASPSSSRPAIAPQGDTRFAARPVKSAGSVDSQFQPSSPGPASARSPSSAGAFLQPAAPSKAGPGSPKDAAVRFNGSDIAVPQITPGASARLLRPDLNQFNAAAGTITAPPVTKVPPPVSFLPDGSPVYGINASLPNSVDSGVLNLRWGSGDCTMNPGTDGYNAKSCSCVNRIGDWYHQYATDTITTEQCQFTYDPYVATAAQSLGCSSVTVTELSHNYTAPTDCCDKCVVQGQSVRLVYWPPEQPQNQTIPKNARIAAAPQGGQRYGTVSDGFTFISPSVYVIYSEIAATASCVARVASSVPIGTVHNVVTRAYDPGALSTAKCMANDAAAGLAWCINPVGDLQASDCFQGLDTGWATIDYAGLYNNPPASVMLSQKQACFTNTIGADFAAMLYRSPQLSFPADVTDIDPQWAAWGGNTCSAGNLGVQDPPRVLGQAVALGPVPQQSPTAAADFGPQPTPAQPGGQVDLPPAPTPITGHRDGPVGGADRVPGFHAPASAMVGPDNGPSGGSFNAPATPNVNYPANPAPVTQNQGPNDPKAVQPAPVNNGAPPTNNGPPTPTNGGIQVDPNSLSNQQMNQIHQALAPAPNPQPQPVAPNGGTSPQGPGSVNQVQPGSPGGTTLVGSGGGNGANGGGAPAMQDPQAVPIVLTPQLPAGGVNAPVQGQVQAQVQPAGQPVAAGIQQPAQGQAQPQSNNVNNGPAPAPYSTVPFVDAAPQIAGNTVQKQADGNVVVGGTTIPQGASAVVDGHTITNTPDHVVVDGATHALTPLPAPATGPAPILASNQIVQVSNGGLQVAGQTLIPGSQVILGGHVVDYVKTGQVVVDGTTNTLIPISTANPLVIDSQTMARAANGGLIIAGSTMVPGAQATVAGHVYSMAGDSSVLVDGQTYALPPTKNAYLVQAMPTVAGSPALDNTRLSPVTLANGLVITPQPSSASGNEMSYLLNGLSISAGGPPAIVAGTTYSALASNAGFLVNGVSTLPIPTTTPVSSSNIFTIAGQTFSASPTGFVLPDGSTVSPGGPAATVSGEVVSLGSGGVLTVGSTTVTLSPVAKATGTGLAPAILSGLNGPGGPAATATATATVPFLGGAGTKVVWRWEIIGLCVGGLWVVMI